MTDYKYDVAFSFLKEDENLAVQLNDLLQSRLSTFLYSKKQEDIAGTDGEETFNRVFGTDARIVVVLYRPDWGNTPWTRIEQTAIRNRAYDEGYEFVIFIPLNQPPKVPKWLPKTRIWIGLERWRIEGAAGVIESRVQEAGGIPHPETIEERAIRLKQEMDIEQKRKRFLASKEGVTAANEEIECLAPALEKLTNAISQETNLKFEIRQSKGREYWIEVYSEIYCVSIDWNYYFISSLENSHLDVELWKGGRPRGNRYFSREPQKVLQQIFNFNLAESSVSIWQDKRTAKLFTTQQLAEHGVKLLIDFLHKEEFSRKD